MALLRIPKAARWFRDAERIGGGMYMVQSAMSSQELLDAVQHNIEAGKSEEAMHLFRRFRAESLEMKNAYGVCLMRLGDIDPAIDVFRSLCLDKGGVNIRPDVPEIALINYATALLMANNVGGCLEALKDVHDPKHPSVKRLMTCISNWRHTLPWWRRAWLSLSGESPQGEVSIDFAPGDLMEDHTVKPAA
jgi:hypothetical protein